MGCVYVHHVGEVPKAAHAAGEVFGKVAAGEVRRTHDGFVGFIFREGFIQAFLLFTPGGIKHVQKGGEGKTQGFSYGNPFPVAGFHVGSHPFGEGSTEEMEIFPIFNAGDIEEAGCDMDDGIGGGKGSGGGRSHPAHLRRHEMEQGAEFSFFTEAGITDFFLHGLEFQCFVIGREAGDEGHVGGFRNGDGRRILLSGQQAACLDGAPAAVHEKKALPVMKEGGDFLHHRFMVRGVGAYHKDVRFFHRLFQVRGEGNIQGRVDFSPYREGRLVPAGGLDAVSHVHLAGHIFQIKISGSGQCGASGADDGNIHGSS